MRVQLWTFLAASLFFIDCSVPDFTPEKAFQWNYPVTPEKHKFHPSAASQDESVTVLLSDSAVLLKSRLYHRYQIFVVDKLVDHSDPSINGFNLQQQLARFSRDKLNNHEGFISLPSFLYEYRFQHQLTYDQCHTLCLFHKSALPTSINHLSELQTLIPRSHEYIWTQVNQSFSNDQDYRVDFDLTEILPTNRFNGNSTTQLFHYHQGEYRPLPISGLHGRVKYYTYERDSYYSRQPHQLLARVDVHNHWQVLVPQWSGTQPSMFGKALCTCVRDLTRNLKNAHRAASLAEEARLRTIRSPQELEIQRVKKVSPSEEFSNVENILRDQQFYIPNQRSYVGNHDLYDLRLDTGSDINVINNDPPTNASRQRRALPLAASLGLGVISKIVQFSVPYMLSDGRNFIQQLKRETGGLLMRAPKQKKNKISFQEYISSRFASSPANFTVESDRLRIDMKYNNPALRSLAEPSLPQAIELESTSRQLQYIEQHVLPFLPMALVQQIIGNLPFPLRPASDILIRVQSSGTFSVIRYFFELHRHDLSYTQIQTFALPFKQTDNKFYAFDIQNTTTMDITKYSNGRLKDKRCLNSVLTNQPTDLGPVCPVTEYRPQIYRQIFSLTTGSILLFPGPSSISLICFQHPALQLSLQQQFNVLYISSSCSVSLVYHQVSTVIPATDTSSNPSHYQILLSIDVPIIASTTEKLFYWMVGLSTSIAIVFIIVVFIYLSMSFVKLRYKPKISINDDGLIDVSVQNVHPNLSKRPSFPQLEGESSETSFNMLHESINPSLGCNPSPGSVALPVGTTEPDKSLPSLPFLKKTKPAAH